MKPTSFAPFSARLEPVPRSGVQYLVLVNSSGRELHNYSFSAYLYSELLRRNPLVRNVPFRQYAGSGATLPSGQVMRFKPIDKDIEDPIVPAVTRVQVVGHCDEGHFRQQWVNTDSGELRPIGD